MKIIEIIKNLFKKNKKYIHKIDDEFNYESEAKLIAYFENHHAMILIGYPNNDLYKSTEALEFLTACNLSNIPYAVSTVSYSEDIEETGEFTPKLNQEIYEKQYILLSAINTRYIDLYDNITSLSNSLLKQIENIIYAINDKRNAGIHINNKILKENMFLDIEPIDKYIKFTGSNTFIPDLKVILPRLSNKGFNKIILMKLIPAINVEYKNLNLNYCIIGNLGNAEVRSYILSNIKLSNIGVPIYSMVDPELEMEENEDNDTVDIDELFYITEDEEEFIPITSNDDIIEYVALGEETNE